VKVWDVQTGQEALTLAGNHGAISNVTFSPDGKRLAASGGDGTVMVWDARILTADEKEAEFLLLALVANHASQAETRSRLRQDATISEAVRRIALSSQMTPMYRP
jgi:WD40 repeat protein